MIATDIAGRELHVGDYIVAGTLNNSWSRSYGLVMKIEPPAIHSGQYRIHLAKAKAAYTAAKGPAWRAYKSSTRANEIYSTLVIIDRPSDEVKDLLDQFAKDYKWK